MKRANNAQRGHWNAGPANSVSTDAAQTLVIELNEADTKPSLDGGTGLSPVDAPTRDLVLTLTGEDLIDDTEKVMPCPTINVGGRKVFILNGIEAAERAHTPLEICAREKLEKVAERHRDAVAFGYVSGKWVPAA